MTQKKEKKKEKKKEAKTNQQDLKGKPVKEKKRNLKAFLSVKHNAIDKITETRKISLYGKIKGKENIGGTNINLSNLSEPKFKDLLDSLGLKSLNKDTPLVLKIEIPEGTLLDDWVEETTKGEGEE